MAFNLQANYTDWATATGQQILVPTFAEREVSRGQRFGIHTGVNLFSRPEELLFLSSSSSFMLTRLSGHHSRLTATQKNLVAPGIEPGNSASAAGTLTTRPQRRSFYL
jgi:hypothetical protein